MGYIFYIMGKSASGKDSIYKSLIETKELNLTSLVIYTTRPIRENEVDGKNYHFVTDEQFEKLKSEGKVIESRSYKVTEGVWNYFTVDDENLNINSKNYLTIGTLESYEKMVKYFGDKTIVPIYLNVENGERLKRAIAREDREENPKYEELCRRFLADEKDFSEEKLNKIEKDCIFDNNNFEKCYREICRYIKEY